MLVMKKIFALLVGTTIYVLLLNAFSKFYLADVYQTFSKNYLANGEFVKAENYADRAIINNPNEPSYRRQKAKVMLANLSFIKEDKAALKKEISQQLLTSRELNSKNLTTLRNVIPLYYFLALKDLTEEASTENIDENYRNLAKEYYSLLKSVYANDLGIITDVAEYERKLYLNDEYQKSVAIVKYLRPEVLDWHGAFN
jgi:hypothetical protein